MCSRARTRWFRMAICAGSLFLCATATADDKSRCAADDGGDPAIEACSRLIAAGKVRGSDLASAYLNRGIEWHSKGEYARAITDYKDALRIDPKRTVALNNLALLYEQQGNFVEAIAFAKRALAALEKAGASNEISLIPTLALLNRLYRSDGKLAESDGMAARVQAIKKKAAESNDPAALNSSALAYLKQGDFDDAETSL